LVPKGMPAVCWKTCCQPKTQAFWGYQIERIIFIVLAHWNNNLRIDMSLHSVTLFWFRTNQSLLFLLNAACLAEKQQIHTHTHTFSSFLFTRLLFSAILYDKIVFFLFSCAFSI
jgi:hypothetical protein